MDLSIVIVSWNCRAELLDCLQSVVRYPYSGAQEIIVVDNASSDGTVEAARQRFPAVRVFEAGVNIGFARAANLGLKAAKGEHILFLNPDTLISAGSLDAALRALQSRPAVGVLGVALLDTKGFLQPSCGRFLSLAALLWSTLRRFVERTRVRERAGGGRLWNSSAVEEVDWLIGAFLLCRRVVLTEVGGFDEDYFLYAEDMDLCYRVWQQGHTILYFPEVTVIHHGNRSGAQKWAEKREGEIVRAELIFLRKHQGRLAALGFRLFAGSLFFAKGLRFWFRAGGQTDPSGIEARRYWHMIKVCLGWK
ncbi:MAG: glycosyltransferase family 2 protein [Deltaproteobacteria bacterium]|nr:glycosyltransferase family 2 protein [Deltaproteobacteria bacterium]